MSNANNPYAGERPIIEFWASMGESNSLNQMAAKLPWFIGGPIYFAIYVLKAVNVFSAVRYTLTNRRLRVDRGTRKNTVQSIPLEEIEDIRLVNDASFTRTGDLEVVSRGKVVLTMAGIQDPAPARLTILDAVRARVQVQKVLEMQSKAKAKAPAAT